jgi:hypothetical protein
MFLMILMIFRTPMNLRPSKLNRYQLHSSGINSNKTIWKIQNRTIYREDENRWLRNENSRAQLKQKNLIPAERELLRKLIEVYGFKHLYPESKFYKTHKITRAEFVAKLENTKSEEEK